MMSDVELPVVTKRTVWELLSRRQNIVPLLDLFPLDEIIRIRQIEHELCCHFSEVERSVLSDLDAIDRSLDVELQLLEAKKAAYPQILVAAMAGSNYADLIWKEIEPHE